MPPGQEKPSRDIIHLPELIRYIRDFGKESDICLVAEFKGILIGAIWTRVFSETEKGYGYVDAETPELTISVHKAFRQKGIGTKLLQFMLDRLRQKGYKQVSLSVDKLNYALIWYQKYGFEALKGDGDSVRMLRKLR